MSSFPTQSRGKFCADIRGDTHRSASLSIDGTPERTRLRQELAIALAPDFGEALEGQPSGFAHPRAKHDFVAMGGGHFVVDLVSQYDLADPLPKFGASDGSPMGGSNILDPAQVNGVVNMILLVDIVGQNRNDHFESGRGNHGQKLEVRS